MSESFSMTADWSHVLEQWAADQARERFEASAKSGEAIPLEIDPGDGSVYDALVTVTKDGDTFTCQPAAPLTKRPSHEPPT